MTDQSITATEARVRAALHRLAESHRPDPDLHRANEPGTGRQTGGPPPSQRRWLLAVASIAVVGAGIVAVALVPNDVEAPPTDSADTIVSTTEPGPTPAPVPTTVPTPAPTTGAPAPVRELRFAEPFDEPMVASLEPDPALPETSALGYDPTAGHAEWAHGLDGFGQVWSISNNEWVGSVSVLDGGVPWEIASEGKTLTEISGIDAVVDEPLSAVALRLPNGRTRLIQGFASEQSDITATQAAVELAEVIGTNSIESTVPTDRFVLPIGVAGRGPVVQYGDRAPVNTTGLTQIGLERLERTPTDDELRWIATSKSEGGELEQLGPGVFEATMSGGQLSLVELVSPLDLVWILAPGRDGHVDAARVDRVRAARSERSQRPTVQRGSHDGGGRPRRTQLGTLASRNVVRRHVPVARPSGVGRRRILGQRIREHVLRSRSDLQQCDLFSPA